MLYCYVVGYIAGLAYERPSGSVHRSLCRQFRSSNQRPWPTATQKGRVGTKAAQNISSGPPLPKVGGWARKPRKTKALAHLSQKIGGWARKPLKSKSMAHLSQLTQAGGHKSVAAAVIRVPYILHSPRHSHRLLRGRGRVYIIKYRGVWWCDVPPVVAVGSKPAGGALKRCVRWWSPDAPCS